jgi:hypothetical protein
MLPSLSNAIFEMPFDKISPFNLEKLTRAVA